MCRKHLGQFEICLGQSGKRAVGGNGSGQCLRCALDIAGAGADNGSQIGGHRIAMRNGHEGLAGGNIVLGEDLSEGGGIGVDSLKCLRSLYEIAASHLEIAEHFVVIRRRQGLSEQ